MDQVTVRCTTAAMFLVAAGAIAPPKALWNPVPAVAQTRPDSQTIHDASRAAQRRFERLRRHHLPWTHRRYGTENETIGRFRFWYDDGPFRAPPREHERIIEGRNALLAELDSAQSLLPGDEWITGQRVRYLTEAGRFDAALAIADACRSTAWWCDGLTGFTLHVRGDFADAERAFDRALRSMPDSVRCRWSNLAEILDADTRRRYRKLDCDERIGWQSRLWWLADPLFIVPGNERRTEHYARVVYDRMLRRSVSTFGMRWGRDNRELVLRFGWPIAWERARSGMSSWGGDLVVGHQRQGAFRFIPPWRYLNDVTSIAANEWELQPERPRARYAPTYAFEFAKLDHQLVAFRRGDSAVVVVAYAVPAIEDDSGRARPFYGDAALFLRSDEHAATTEVRARAGRPLAARVPRQPQLVALEVLSRPDSVAGRERHWIDFAGLSDPFAISDLMLTARADPLPRSLAEAIPLAAPAFAAQPAQEVGLYWELYNPAPDTGSVTVSLTVEKLDKGILRKAGEFLGVVGRSRDWIAMRWSDAGTGVLPVMPRSITIRLPEVRGRYLVTLAATGPDGSRAATSRELVIRP